MVSYIETHSYGLLNIPEWSGDFHGDVSINIGIIDDHRGFECLCLQLVFTIKYGQITSQTVSKAMVGELFHSNLIIVYTKYRDVTGNYGWLMRLMISSGVVLPL